MGSALILDISLVQLDLNYCFPLHKKKKNKLNILTIRSVNHDCVTNSKQKKELLNFWLLSRFYLLYQIVIIEQELSICIHVPAEIHSLLRKQKKRGLELSHVQLLCAYRISSYFGKGMFPVLQTVGTSAPDWTDVPLGGSEAALLHPDSLLQCKHHQLEGTGQNNKVFTTHSQSKKIHRISTALE